MSSQATAVFQLLSHLDSSEDPAERVQLLQSILQWVNRKSLISNPLVKSNRLQIVRIKFLLQTLDKNPELLASFLKNFFNLIVNADLEKDLCDVGLGQELSFFQELGERLINKALPETTLPTDLLGFLHTSFIDDEEIVWVEEIDEEVFLKLFSLFYDSYKKLNPDSIDLLKKKVNRSLSRLISQIRSFGLSESFQSRSKQQVMSESPFFKLIYLDPFLQTNLTMSSISALQLIDLCIEQTGQVVEYLDDKGISISIIFQIERVQKELSRLKLLYLIQFELNLNKNQRAFLFKDLFIDLIKTSHANKQVSQLFRDSFQLLARKVVDRNSEIGDHYLISDKKDFFKILKKSCGGGAITSLTVAVKYLTYTLAVAPFILGLVHAINYSLSFLAIHFMGMTLATKQPAATAATIAFDVDASEKTDSNMLIEKIFSILRAQIVAITGNLLLVIPAVVFISFLYKFLFSRPLLDTAEIHHIIQSVDIVGGTALFAAFTGVLLFVSSIVAGWMDNWFIYRQIEQKIKFNQKLCQRFGNSRVEWTSLFLKKHIASISANISLGFLLGITPLVLKFIGLPLDIRHVTLSTGALALALSSFDFAIGYEQWLRCILGLISIGALNVSVSFYLALRFAFAAKKVSSKKKYRIYKLFFTELFKNPKRLFVPG